jgi:molecular chaperone DnaK (HSP70)
VDAAVLIGDWAYLPQLQVTVARALGLRLAVLHTIRAETLAVEGAALAAADDAPTVWDVTPYPLGINCYFADEELLSPIVAANTPIPTPPAGAPGANTERYWTRYADQRQVRLDVLQYRGPRDANPHGEGRVRPQECEKLGSWEFGGLSPRPGECAAFTVTFAVDADGILQLEARETATGHTLSARVNREIG